MTRPPVSCAPTTPASSIPGFGYDAAGARFGSRAALEVRARDVPFMVEHRQPICKLAFEAMLEPPDRLYGARRGLQLPGSGDDAEQALRRADRREPADDAERWWRDPRGDLATAQITPSCKAVSSAPLAASGDHPGSYITTRYARIRRRRNAPPGDGSVSERTTDAGQDAPAPTSLWGPSELRGRDPKITPYKKLLTWSTPRSPGARSTSSKGNSARSPADTQTRCSAPAALPRSSAAPKTRREAEDATVSGGRKTPRAGSTPRCSVEKKSRRAANTGSRLRGLAGCIRAAVLSAVYAYAIGHLRNREQPVAQEAQHDDAAVQRLSAWRPGLGALQKHRRRRRQLGRRRRHKNTAEGVGSSILGGLNIKLTGLCETSPK